MTTTTNGDNIASRDRRHWLGVASLTAGLASMSCLPTLAAESKTGKPTAVSPALKPEKRNLVLAVTNPAALPNLPLLVAQQNGFLAQQGLTLEISEQQSPARAIAAVVAGSADAFCGWFEHLLSAPGRAASLRCFALMGAAPMMALGVPMRPSPAEMPANLLQLRGRKIGVVALNSPTHTVALAALRRAGLRGNDVGFVSVGSPASAAQALRSGQIDALMHFDPLMLELEQRGEIMTLCNLRTPGAAFSVLGAHLPSSCLAAAPDFFQRFPGSAQALSDALVQALQWLQQASLREVLQLQQGLPEGSQSINTQSFIASFERLRFAYSNNGICDLTAATSLLQAMHDAEPSLRLEKIDPAQSINNALAQKSGLRLKGWIQLTLSIGGAG